MAQASAAARQLVGLVDRGRVVWTYGDIEELSYLASCRKSVLSMLYGYWVENGTIILIGATTENPFFTVNSPLVSRRQVVQKWVERSSQSQSPVRRSRSSASGAVIR